MLITTGGLDAIVHKTGKTILAEPKTGYKSVGEARCADNLSKPILQQRLSQKNSNLQAYLSLVELFAC